MPKAELDATGLKCPLPVLKARKAIKGLATGDQLQITATDPGSPADMRAFCESQGHQMVESTEQDGLFTFLVEKG